MTKLKTFIVDDEELARKNLAFLLNDNCPNVEITGEASSMAEAIAFLEKNKVDLVLLDIEMPNGTGFDLLEKIKDRSFDFSIIFVTAYHEYALKAFKYSAVDYLLKPINPDELTEAVSKVSHKQGGQSKEQIENLMEQLGSKAEVMSKIALPSMEGLKFINLNDIVYCESQDNYTNFYLTSGDRIMVSKTIKHFEEILDPNRFFRVHRSNIVNLKFIDKYVKGEGGYIVMKQGNRIPVSRRRKESFLQLFQVH